MQVPTYYHCSTILIFLLKKDLEVNVDESAEAATQLTASYDLRNGAKVKNSLTKTKFETLTFGYFFPRLLLAFQHIDFSLRKDSFQTHLNANINTNLKIFFDIFPKFDVKYCNFYKRKKKKGVIKIKKNIKNVKRLNQNKKKK
jgi:hypothetical protein